MIEKNQLFLDNYGEVWITASPVVLENNEWWCRRNDTNFHKLFKSTYIEEKIQSYQNDLKDLKLKNNIEKTMFNVIKEITKNIITDEYSCDEWSDIELEAIKLLSKGKFSIEHLNK